MKKHMLLKSGFFIGAVVLSLAFSGCEEDDDNIFDLSGPGSGANERPNPVNTTATGNISGTYNEDNNQLQYTITWNGLAGGNPTAMHFHAPALPSQAVGVALPITGFTAAASGSYSNTVTIHDTLETHLLNGLVYYNIHNATYPGGEVRGNIVATRR